MRSLHIHTDSVSYPYVTGLSPRVAGPPAAIVGRGSCPNCFSLHSSALKSSSKMAGSPLIDCKPTRICCQNCVQCEFLPFYCVTTKYLKLTLCTPQNHVVHGQRHQGVRLALNTRIKTSQQDVRGHAESQRVKHFSLPRMNSQCCRQRTCSRTT